MLILAIDSTMNGCSAGVWDSENNNLSSQSLELNRGQAEHLMPMVENALKDAKKTYEQIDLIAVTNGPGAFTGMRIGLATAKALGLSLEKPVIGVCTLRSILKTYLSEQNTGGFNKYCAVVLETKRQDYYFQLFDKDMKAVTDKQACDKDIIVKEIDNIGQQNVTVVGDAFLRLKEDVPDEGLKDIDHQIIKMPDIRAVAMLACDTYEDKKDGIFDCVPQYLRPPDVSISKTPKRMIKTQ